MENQNKKNIGIYNKLVNEKKESIIFIKGNEEYINKVNKNLKQIKDYKNMEIIDCYNLEEIGSKTNSIIQSYKSILSVKGLNK